MKRSMKRLISLSLAAGLVMASFAGCGNSGGSGEGASEITVVSREDGSGTRGAFIELFGIQEENAAGEKVDMTTVEASITNNTSVMMTTVAGNKNAVGYISLGSLNDTVKAVSIDGVDATVENVEDGSYKIARPFNIATKGDLSPAAKDFISFIMSKEGQAVVEESGYIPVAGEESFHSGQPSGKLVIAGSSSVAPVMEKLKESYAAVNPNATLEIQQSDSSTGMSSVTGGICDIGMASRELKASELDAGLNNTVIAMDGIAVIVNKENAAAGLTSEQVRSIFTGETTLWENVQ